MGRVVFVGSPKYYKPLRDRVASELGIAPSSDNYDLPLHRGTRCRKMHSSDRTTFRTIGADPDATASRSR